MMNNKPTPILVHLLEFGIDEYYNTTEGIINMLLFSTIEEACARAIRYEDNYPSILLVDLATKKVLKRWDNIPKLDKEIGA